jgi:hypothetical protein
VPRFVAASLDRRARHGFAAEAVLDKLNRGIVIFGQDATVHFLNDAAMRLVGDGVAFHVTDGRLRFAEPRAQVRFNAYLNAGLESAAGGADPSAVVMRIDPGGAATSLRLLLSPLRVPTDPTTLLLYDGESLGSAAQRLHVSPNTAKTHLHHVFLKCDVHSQAELLQLLSLGPRTL